MTGGGEGPSVAEVAASLPARLLGAMEELEKFLKYKTKKEEKEICFLRKFEEKLTLSFSLSGVYRHKMS